MTYKNTTTPNNLYTQNAGNSSSDPFITEFQTRDPTTGDVNFPIQKRWINTSTGDEFILVAFNIISEVKTAIWLPVAGSGSTGEVDSLTGDDDIPVLPTANNINFDGQVVANATNAKALYFKNTSVSTLTAQIQVGGGSTSSNIAIAGVISANTLTSSIDSNGFMSPFQFAELVVNPIAGLGTHTTITAALAAATAGDLIYIAQGTYVENITLKSEVDLCSWGTNGMFSVQSGPSAANVIIQGTTTASYSGSVNLYGIQLETNGATALSMTGSNVCLLSLVSCSIFANDATGFTLNNSSSVLNFYGCTFTSSSTNNLFTATSTGGVDIENCVLSLSASGTPSTVAAGRVLFNACDMFGFNGTTSSSGGILVNASYWQYGGQTLLTTSGTGTSEVFNSYCRSDNAITFTVGSGTILNIANSQVFGTSSSCINGAGTVNYSEISFISNNLITTTTQKCFNGNTFVPVLAFGGASVGITYSIQAASYLREDNICQFYIDIELSSKGSSTGAATISGLPFASRNANTTDIPIVITNITAPALTTYYHAEIANGATSLSLISDQAATGGVIAVADTNFANNTIIRIQGSYFI